jgi:hypothetical protein
MIVVEPNRDDRQASARRVRLSNAPNMDVDGRMSPVEISINDDPSISLFIRLSSTSIDLSLREGGRFVAVSIVHK